MKNDDLREFYKINKKNKKLKKDFRDYFEINKKEKLKKRIKTNTEQPGVEPWAASGIGEGVTAEPELQLV